jgi:hypothetical protein
MDSIFYIVPQVGVDTLGKEKFLIWNRYQVKTNSRCWIGAKKCIEGERMKRIVSAVSMFSVLALTACATSQSELTQKNPSSDRKISSVNGVTHENTTDRFPFDPTCNKGSSSTDVYSNPGQVFLVSTSTRVESHPQHVAIYDCETTQTDGNGKGDWKGFYDQAGDKAQQLADAILGVGYHPKENLGHQGVAPFLVPYFQNKPKPRNWSDFSARITDAAEKIKAQYGLETSWKTNVLGQYKMENMEHLGYMGGSNTACNITGYDDTPYSVRTEESITRIPVELHVSGGKLLPGECETYAVSFDGLNVTGSSDSTLNTYQSVSDYDSITADYSRSGRKVVVTMRSTGRNKVEAPYFIKGPATSTPISQGNGSATLTLSTPDYHALANVPEFANACKVTATGSFYAKKGNGANGKKDKATTQNVSVALNINSDSAVLSASGIQITDPKKQHIGATVNQTMSSGCPFYAPATKEVGKWD